MRCVAWRGRRRRAAGRRLLALADGATRPAWLDGDVACHSERDHRGARTDQPQGLLVRLQAWLLQQQPGEHAEQTGADCGQRTEQTFGVPGTIPLSEPKATPASSFVGKFKDEDHAARAGKR
jgi:hypothetical protein